MRLSSSSTSSRARARAGHLQVRFFARRYRDDHLQRSWLSSFRRPDRGSAYSQDHAVEDIRGLLDALGIERAHVCGLSMGGYATLHFGLRHPGRALSLVVAGCGYGSVAADRAQWKRDTEATAQRFLTEPMATMADVYCQGPTRVQFRDKDPKGWQEFHDHVRRAVGSRPRPDDARRPAHAARRSTSSSRSSSA